MSKASCYLFMSISKVRQWVTNKIRWNMIFANNQQTIIWKRNWFSLAFLSISFYLLYVNRWNAPTRIAALLFDKTSHLQNDLTWMRLDWFEYGRKSRPDLLKKNERMQSFAIYLSMFPTTNFSDTAIHDLEKFGNRRRGPFCIFDQIKRWKFLITTEYYKGSPLFSVTIMAGEREIFFGRR